MVLYLPWPPSVNTYWRHPTRGRLAGRHLLSEQGREYRQRVKEALLWQQWAPFDGLVAVDVALFPPDRRVRDADNYEKSLLDALTCAGLWVDDHQVATIQSTRYERVEFGLTVVKIKAISQPTVGNLPALAAIARAMHNADFFILGNLAAKAQEGAKQAPEPAQGVLDLPDPSDAA